MSLATLVWQSSLVGPTVQDWPLDICSFACTDFQLRLEGMVLSWLDLCCQSLDLTPGFDAKRNLTAITTQQNNWRRRINRRIKGTYSTWRYKSVRLPTGAPREQQLHSTYHLRGSVSLVKPSVNSKKLFALKRIDGGIWSFNVPFVLEAPRRLAWCYVQRCILSHAMRPLKNTCQKTFHPMQHSFLMMKDTIIHHVRVQHALLNKILHSLYWKTEQYSQLKPDESSFPSSMQM